MNTPTRRTLVSCAALAAAAVGLANSVQAGDCDAGSFARRSACKQPAETTAPAIGAPWITPDGQISGLLLDPPDLSLAAVSAMSWTELSAPLGSPANIPKTAPVPGARIAPWSKLDTTGSAGASAHSARSGVGLDIKPSGPATVGMAMESDENIDAATRAQQTSRALAAKFGLAPSPLLNFEAKAKWAHSSTGDIGAAGVDTSQSEVSARMLGNWRFGGITLAPSVDVSRTKAEPIGEGARPPPGKVVVAPRLASPVALKDGRTLEPFITFKHEQDAGTLSAHTSSGAKSDATRAAGGGLKLDRPESYSLSVTADVENLDAEQRNIKSQLRLSVPLR